MILYMVDGISLPVVGDTHGGPRRGLCPPDFDGVGYDPSYATRHSNSARAG